MQPERAITNTFLMKYSYKEVQYCQFYLDTPPTQLSRSRDWLVGCFGFNGPLRQYFSLYRAVSQREGERGVKRIDESKNVQTTPTRTYYKRSRPLPCCNPNCRTPRNWKFTQHHRTTRPPLPGQETLTKKFQGIKPKNVNQMILCALLVKQKFVE